MNEIIKNNVKLTAIQKELKVPKNQFNAFGKYNYRNAEDILEAVKPLLIKHGCTLFLSDEIVLIGDRYYIKATANFHDGENLIVITAYAREEETKKGMDGSQITGASSSYARKYALNGLFLIDDTKDSDSTNKHDTNEDSLDALKKELNKYTDPISLDENKVTIRDKYVKLGLDKKTVTNLIQTKLNEF